MPQLENNVFLCREGTRCVSGWKAMKEVRLEPWKLWLVCCAVLCGCEDYTCDVKQFENGPIAEGRE